jgi:hypothetical protein
MPFAFTVVLTNFGTSREFATLARARAFAEGACFESFVTFDGERVAGFSPISGWHEVAGERLDRAAVHHS